LSGWGNSKFTYVFASGIAGVGIVIWKGSVGITPTPYVVQSYGTTGVIGTTNTHNIDTSFSFGLIKIGNIAPGTINGTNFPTVVYACEQRRQCGENSNGCPVYTAKCAGHTRACGW
jgi:hypothetical protein